MVNGIIWILLDTSGVGGIETHVTNLVSALRQRRINAQIVMLKDHGAHPLMNDWEKAGIPVQIIRGGLNGFIKSLRKQKPNLVHTHGYKAGILGRCLCKLFNIPVVNTYHAGEPGNGRVRVYNAIDKMTGFLSDNIAVSSQIARTLTPSCNVISNFVDLPERPTYGSSKIAFVGRLSHEKGPDRFIELAYRIPECQFDIYGDGSMRAELGVHSPDNIKFHGSVSSMSSYWSKIGLLCIPSRYEGLPLVALEAMSYGVPVVAFNVGALNDVIDGSRNGYIVPANDLYGMIRKIRIWHGSSHTARKKISNRARARIQDRYSTYAVIPEIIKIYDKAFTRLAPKIGSESPTEYLCGLQ